MRSLNLASASIDGEQHGAIWGEMMLGWDCGGGTREERMDEGRGKRSVIWWLDGAGPGWVQTSVGSGGGGSVARWGWGEERG